MNVQSKGMDYRVLLAENDNIKILINDNEVFNETINTGKEGKIDFKFQESIFPES